MFWAYRESWRFFRKISKMSFAKVHPWQFWRDRQICSHCKKKPNKYQINIFMFFNPKNLREIMSRYFFHVFGNGTMNRSLSSVPRSFQEKGFEKNAKSIVPPAWKPLFQMIGQFSWNCSRMDGICSNTGICKKNVKMISRKKS